MLIQFFLTEPWESFAEVDKSKSHQVRKYSFLLFATILLEN